MNNRLEGEGEARNAIAKPVSPSRPMVLRPEGSPGSFYIEARCFQMHGRQRPTETERLVSRGEVFRPRIDDASRSGSIRAISFALELQRYTPVRASRVPRSSRRPRKSESLEK